jgi:protein-tyrosine-phosphatase
MSFGGYHGLVQSRPINVLFVSRENACRSLMAEACLNKLATDKLRAYSCGDPDAVAKVPYGWALLAMQTSTMPTKDLRCKAWSEFSRNSAPKMDFVIALDAPTSGRHPSWPGQPETAMWEYPEIDTGRAANPALAAIQLLHSLRRRIELFSILCSKGLSRDELRNDLRDLGHLR